MKNHLKVGDRVKILKDIGVFISKGEYDHISKIGDNYWLKQSRAFIPRDVVLDFLLPVGEDKASSKDKIGITKKQAAAIKLLLKENNGDKDKVLDIHCYQGLVWDGAYAQLTELSPSDLAKALYLGYEIKPEPIDSDPKVYKLWARVGVAIEVREDQIDLFMKDQQRFVRQGLGNGSARLDGEAYFPEEIEENFKFEEVNGELGWNL